MSETKYRSIDIDFDVYKLIMVEKRGFDEADNDALRRLLNLPDPTEASIPSPNGMTGSWRHKGVELPDGTRLRMTYSGTEHCGMVVDGKWKFGDDFYNTPSGAASGVARTKAGDKTSLNGWKHWHVKRPSDTTWVLLDKLRNGNLG